MSNSEIKRYLVTDSEDFEEPDGEYVLFSDIEPVLKDNEELKRRLADYDSGMAQNNAVQHIAKENEELKKKLDKAIEWLKKIEDYHMEDHTGQRDMAQEALKEIE